LKHQEGKREGERERDLVLRLEEMVKNEDDQLSEGTENITGSSFQVSVLD